jgi:hypothetical protein
VEKVFCSVQKKKKIFEEKKNSKKLQNNLSPRGCAVWRAGFLSFHEHQSNSSEFLNFELHFIFEVEVFFNEAS